MPERFTQKLIPSLYAPTGSIEAPVGMLAMKLKSAALNTVTLLPLSKLAAWGPLSKLLASGLIVATTLPVRALANHRARKRTEHCRVRRQGETPNSEITSAHIQTYSR